MIYAGEQVQLTRIDDNGKKSASLSTLPGIFSRVIDRSQIKFQRFEGAARMATRNIGIVIDGATGRLGTTQHLRSLMAIRRDGGLVLANGDRLVPEPVLLGRNPAKLAVLATANGDLKWSTDRDICLADPGIAIYFDANTTGGRSDRSNWRRRFLLDRHADLMLSAPPTRGLIPETNPAPDGACASR